MRFFYKCKKNGAFEKWKSVTQLHIKSVGNLEPSLVILQHDFVTENDGKSLETFFFL